MIVAYCILASGDSDLIRVLGTILILAVIAVGKWAKKTAEDRQEREAEQQIARRQAEERPEAGQAPRAPQEAPQPSPLRPAARQAGQSEMAQPPLRPARQTVITHTAVGGAGQSEMSQPVLRPVRQTVITQTAVGGAGQSEMSQPVLRPSHQTLIAQPTAGGAGQAAMSQPALRRALSAGKTPPPAPASSMASGRMTGLVRGSQRRAGSLDMRGLQVAKGVREVKELAVPDEAAGASSGVPVWVTLLQKQQPARQAMICHEIFSLPKALRPFDEI